MTLLISASGVARITGMSHQCPASVNFLKDWTTLFYGSGMYMQQFFSVLRTSKGLDLMLQIRFFYLWR
jgi:hypothetical protein